VRRGLSQTRTRSRPCTDTLLHDARFALRTIRKQRGTSTVAVICLALGIGANTAIFSVVRAVLMESLPYGNPARIVRVYETANFAGTRGTGSVSVPNYLDWRAEQRPFVDLAAYSSGSVDLAGEGNPELLSAAGIYGVMSYAVSQRQREIGIRMALGARASTVTRMVLSEAGTLAAIGLAIGLVAAMLLTRVMSSMVYGVGTRDPATFAAVALLLVAVALAASLVPAMRAARVDPLRAMRIEG
jgi:ABC-type antimicrobial peptide transport system permease subunit